MAGLDEKTLLSIVDHEFESAMGKSGGEISIERAKAWDYYLSKPLGNEVEGQSKVVTSDVADVVDGMMPSLLRIFTTADNLVSFDAVGPEDEEQAAQESDYVNYVFFKQNPAFRVLYNWFFDALVQKNGIVKAWWDESEVVSTESYEGLSQSELFELLSDEELEPIERSEHVEETFDETTGQIGQTVTHDVLFRRVSTSGRVRVDNVPPEEFRISSDARSIDPSEARMVGQEREITRSDLIAMGFDADVVDDLPASTSTMWSSEEELARRDRTDEIDIGGTRDRSQDLITVRETYIEVDYDGDGRAELRQVFCSGNVVLSNEPVDRQPFHVISPQPMPHKHFGRAYAEKAMDIQEVTTTLLRQTLDNLYHTNNPSHGVWEQGMGENTLDDLLSTRVGSVKRFSRPVGESYAPITVPFTAGASGPMLEYWDKVKRDRTGVNADSEGLSPEALKNIQTTVLAQANDLSKMKQEAVARIFAETGIKSMMLHIHELLQKHQQKDQVVRLRNQWIAISPAHWRTRMDMTVNIGLGIGNREQNMVHLNGIWEKQREIVQAGGLGTIVTPQNIFNTAAELVKNANLKDPEMFFTQFDGEMPAQNDEAMQLQQQQMQIAQRQQELDAQNQQLKVQKMMLEHQKSMEDMQIKWAELQQKDQSREDNLMIELEKISNALTKMELDSGVNVPGSKV
jgi:hypothetical protein